MTKPVRKSCEVCGEKCFILMKAEGKLQCRLCISHTMLGDIRCAICRVENTVRRRYKKRGLLCVQCLIAAMSADEEEIIEKVSPKPKEPEVIVDHGIFHIGSDAWIEQNEHYQRLVKAWTKEIGRKV